jgi:AcrR family transcriptional regulator
VTAHLERPLRRDASRNRERALTAARELFAERGLDVTMDEIARHAGVGVGTVYRRFPQREQIIQALFEQRMEDFLALSERSLADPDAWHGLVEFLEQGLAMQAADRGLKELLAGHGHGGGSGKRMRERVIPMIEQLVARAQAAGALRPDVGALDLPMVSLMIGQVIDFTHEVEPELWRRYLALLLDGLRTEGSALPLAPLDPAQLDAAIETLHPSRH